MVILRFKLSGLIGDWLSRVPVAARKARLFRSRITFKSGFRLPPRPFGLPTQSYGMIPQNLRGYARLGVLCGLATLSVKALSATSSAGVAWLGLGKRGATR